MGLFKSGALSASFSIYFHYIYIFSKILTLSGFEVRISWFGSDH